MSGYRFAIDGFLKRYRFLKPLLGIAPWLGWLASAAVLMLNPQISSLAILLLVAVVVIGLATVSTVVLALAYRRFLATWLGLAGLVTAWALALKGMENETAAVSSVLSLFQISLPVAYLVSVIALLWKRDVSVPLFAGLLMIMVWTMALGVVQYGGAANFLIAYFSAEGGGGFWWWNAISSIMLCSTPPVAAAFIIHLLRLLYLDLIEISSARGG